MRDLGLEERALKQTPAFPSHSLPRDRMRLGVQRPPAHCLSGSRGGWLAFLPLATHRPSLIKEMEDQAGEPRSAEWPALRAGEPLGFLHVMGIRLDLIFFFLALVPSLFLLSPEGGLWRSLVPWEAGGGCRIRLLRRRWWRPLSWCL